ncbi:MAG: hypothetical protein H8F28_17280, partial [Fibrella sp.]|nr:hypothetical protein [Armatimonadota bacterium]
KIYLCAEHHADDKWVGERLAEYRAPAANTPPPSTAQAVAARAEYEKRLASCIERGVYPDKELFVEENAVSETALKTLPPGVNEAYQFYTRTVTDGDFGSAQVYLWQVSGKPIYIVLCTTDGSDGWVEVYDAHGKPLGCATTDDYKPTWTTKGVARRRVWGE